jgi:hypothetical protein
VPSSFFKEEQKKCLEEGEEGWNEVQDFSNSLSSGVQRDGWARRETFDALGIFQDLREAVLTELKGEDRKQYEKRTPMLEKAK